MERYVPDIVSVAQSLLTERAGLQPRMFCAVKDSPQCGSTREAEELYR